MNINNVYCFWMIEQFKMVTLEEKGLGLNPTQITELLLSRGYACRFEDLCCEFKIPLCYSIRLTVNAAKTTTTIVLITHINTKLKIFYIVKDYLTYYKITVIFNLA